ncbi:MAG: polysaccharide biosynthesis protein, partial [Nonomuraea sp.]|nr:polysaccharide biosynthesis protein [Nonomuraea sp.]
MAPVMVRRGIAGLTGAGVSALAQFLVVVVVTRAFSAEQAGAFFSVTALALMAAGIAKLDAGNGLVYFIARAKTYEYRGISGYLRAAAVPCAVAACAAGVLLEPRIGVLAWALPVIVLGDVALAATRGFGSMRPTVLLDGVLLPAAQLVLVGWVALAEAPEWLPVAWGLPYLPLLVLAVADLRGRAPRTPYLPGTGRDLWRYTAPRSAAAAIQ